MDTSSPMEGTVKISGLPPSNEEEGVDLSDAIPAREVAEGWISVREGQEQEGDCVMEQDQAL